MDPSFEKQAFALDIRYFAYDSLDYAKLVYSGSQDPKTLGKRIKIKRYDSAVRSNVDGAFLIRNDKKVYGHILDEEEKRARKFSFGLFQ